MKNKLFFVIVIAMVLLYSQCSESKKPTEESESIAKVEKFEINKGVNLSHWLSQSSKRGEERAAYITRGDFDYIKSIGYDHVRIPVDEEQMFSEDGKKESDAFELLHNGIGWAMANDLNVIVDLHILRSHHFNADEKPLWTEPAAQEQFFECWRKLSSELKNYPNSKVAYELMNEPVADDPEDWNKLVASAISVVREAEPERYLVIGSNRWQSAATFDDLKVPENDKHIILSFHFYEPFLLTHHNASWTFLDGYEGPVKYPGLVVEKEDAQKVEDATLRGHLLDGSKVFTRDTLEMMMAKPIQKSKELGLQLYCGEWGCLPNVPRESFINWYTDMRSVLEKNNIAWANWDYKGGFGILDRANDNKPIEDLTKVLVK